MEIRPTRMEDLETVMAIYRNARAFMAANGNPTQWKDGYPLVEVVQRDIADGYSYVCCGDQGEILCVFYFREGEDSTYKTLLEGKWQNEDDYGVIHRIASSQRVKGVASYCMDWCWNRCGNLKIDTHEDNIVMQKVLEKNGFVRCGIVYAEDGTPRYAYQQDSRGRRNS